MLKLPQFVDARGSLTALEGKRDVPFAVARVYYLYDMPPGAERAGHAVREVEQVFIAVAGSFRVRVNDGSHQGEFVLSHPGEGLYLGPMVWREMAEFAPGSVCLALASQRYSPKLYYHTLEEFYHAVRGGVA